MDLNSTMEGPSPGEQEHACRETGILANEDWRVDKKSSKKDSMDSGVAGLRDQHLNSNNKSCSGCTDTDSSEIEVSSGKTTYLKGKFLGKSNSREVIRKKLRICAKLPSVPCFGSEPSSLRSKRDFEDDALHGCVP
ncbi:Protein of unknown function [Gryllus bimaculatus]|nr:Protein of unknown function [Gryllus bimaculatus]